MLLQITLHQSRDLIIVTAVSQKVTLISQDRILQTSQEAITLTEVIVLARRVQSEAEVDLQTRALHLQGQDRQERRDLNKEIPHLVKRLSVGQPLFYLIH